MKTNRYEEKVRKKFYTRSSKPTINHFSDAANKNNCKRSLSDNVILGSHITFNDRGWSSIEHYMFFTRTVFLKGVIFIKYPSVPH